MKKVLKGFTLIELIVVMAVMTILMASLVNLMVPIRKTYVDSTYFESQRNTQNGISKYITENIRYATCLGIYNGCGGFSGNVTTAVKEFKDKYAATHGGAVLDESLIHVITIDNNRSYNFNSRTFGGRVIKNKPVAPGGHIDTTAEQPDSKQGRLALGPAYYGENSYSINVTVDLATLDPSTGELGEAGIDVQVSSLVKNSTAIMKQATNSVKIQDITSKSNNLYCVTTQSDVVCRNLTLGSGFIDISKAGTNGTNKTTAGTVTDGKKVYIVYTFE